MPTIEQREAMLEQLDKCTPDAWVALVSYMAKDLTAEQGFLAEMLCREAERRAEKATVGTAKHYSADHLATVLSDVGLRLVVSE